ncbi:Immunoglobulin I-set, partial [Trinorchestia longiramus]
VSEPPRLTVPEAFEMLTVPRSDDRSLLCPIIGTPTPIFEWYKDGESVPEDARWDRITVSESRLRLKDAQLEDSGRYVCTAVNGFGKLNYTFVVTVNDPLAPPSLHEDQGAPTLLQVYPPSPGPPIIKKASQSVTLKCRVGGIPEPVVVWYKDGIPVSMDGSPALSRSNDLHTLHIGRLHRSDAGLYTCTATNLYGPVTANWTLRVKGEG